MSLWWEIRSRPWLGPVLAAAILVVWWCAPLLIKAYYDHEAALEEARKLAGLGRTPEVRKLSQTDPVAAVGELDAIVESPEHEEERRVAVAMLPGIVAQAYRRRMQEQQYDQAEVFLKRMKSQWPEDAQTRDITENWSGSLGQRAVDAMKSLDEVMAQKLYRDYRTTGRYLPASGVRAGQSHVLEAFSLYKFQQWCALSAADRKTDKGLEILKESTEALLRFNQMHARIALLRKDSGVPGGDLVALAVHFENKGLQEQAFNLYGVARVALNAGVRWTSDEDSSSRRGARRKEDPALETMLDYKLATLGCALGVRMYSKAGSVLSSLPAAEWLEEVAHYIESPVYVACVQEQKLAIQTAEAIALSEPLMAFDLEKIADESYPQDDRNRLAGVLEEAKQRLATIDRTRREVFDTWLRDTNATLWTKVDAAVVSEVERTVPAGTRMERFEAARRNRLRDMVRDGSAPMPVPVPDAFAKRVLEIRAREGIQAILNLREQAIGVLRPILRTSGDTALNGRIMLAVQKAFLGSRKKEDFQALIELAGFYAAEFGDRMEGDPFKADYRTTLESAAARFLTTDNMKYIFVQALLASAFPNEEVGSKAQAEVMDRAFRAVDHVPPKKDADAVALPSGIPGCSFVAVDNATEYHILVCYDGPERFTVLCNPYRKGTVVMRSGAYRVAVITPSGKIRPYREESAYTDQYRRAEYHIVESGSRVQTSGFASASASGSYAILRAPADVPGLKIDPKTGVVSR